MTEALIGAAIAVLLATIPVVVRLFVRLSQLEGRLTQLEERTEGINDALVDTIVAAMPNGAEVARVYELENDRYLSKVGRRRLSREP